MENKVVVKVVKVRILSYGSLNGPYMRTEVFRMARMGARTCVIGYRGALKSLFDRPRCASA